MGRTAATTTGGVPPPTSSGSPSDAGDDGEVWLEFGAANSSADVYLNGTHLGHHDGGYSAFRCELTPALDSRATTCLAVTVDNAPNTTTYPQRADFTFYGGIYRDVTLITVPRSHFALDDHGGPGLVVTPTARRLASDG